MKIAPFHLERYQSINEHAVEINLSESGVGPMTLHGVLAAADLEGLLSLPLGYSQTNGTPELRGLIAGLHGEATPAHVEVTIGGSADEVRAGLTRLETVLGGVTTVASS